MNPSINTLILTLAALFILFPVQETLSAQNPEMALQVAGDDVVTVLDESAEHTIFTQLVEETQLDETLRQAGPYTVLAPNDEAFEALGSELDEIRQNPDQLQNLVINHLFTGQASADDVEENFGVEVEQRDMEASNGVVHGISEVRLAP